MVNMKRNDFIQEIFDKVSKHLLKQNKKAVNDEGSYRLHYKKLRCSVGCLIPDRDYIPQMENLIFAHRISYFEEAGYLDHELSFINELQVIHDCYEPNQWSKKLKILAKINNLKFKGIKT